jgi:hypothetical protein
MTCNFIKKNFLVQSRKLGGNEGDSKILDRQVSSLICNSANKDDFTLSETLSKRESFLKDWLSNLKASQTPTKQL